jgi:hypothetical protein
VTSRVCCAFVTPSVAWQAETTSCKPLVNLPPSRGLGISWQNRRLTSHFYFWNELDAPTKHEGRKPHVHLLLSLTCQSIFSLTAATLQDLAGLIESYGSLNLVVFLRPPLATRNTNCPSSKSRSRSLSIGPCNAQKTTEARSTSISECEMQPHHRWPPSSMSSHQHLSKNAVSSHSFPENLCLSPPVKWAGAGAGRRMSGFQSFFQVLCSVLSSELALRRQNRLCSFMTKRRYFRPPHPRQAIKHR